MAKHKKRYGDYRTAPFGFIKASKGEVEGTDVILGAVIGLIGGAFIQGVFNKMLEKSTMDPKTKSFIAKVLPGLSSLGSGAGLYCAQKKSKRGKGHLVGASALGAGLLTWDMLKGTPLGLKLHLQGYNDYVSVPGLSAYYPSYGNQYGGVITDNPAGQLQGCNAYDGVITDNPAGRLQGLAESAMEHDSYDGLFAAA